MIRTQIQLTQKQAEALRRIAAREKISVAEVVRRAVDRVAETDVLPDWEELKRRAIAAAGCGHSDVTDLSTRHDEYFVEAILE